MDEDQEIELTPEMAKQFTDEELSKVKTGEISVKDMAAKYSASTRSQEPEEEVETEEAPETPEKPAEAPPASTPPEETFPDYVPESMRKHYKEKNVDEFAKSMSHFQKLVGDVSQFKPILDYWKADPDAYRKYVENLVKEKDPSKTKEGKPPEPASEEPDDLEVTLKSLEDGNIDSVGALRKIASSIDSKVQKAVMGIRQELENRDEGQIRSEIEKANTKAIDEFVGEIKDIVAFDDSTILDFLRKVPTTVLPTGGEGKMRYFTKRDLIRAFKDIYEEKWDAYQKQKFVASIKKDIGSEEEIITPSGTTIQHDKSMLKRSGLDKAKTREEMEALTRGLSDEELQEEMKKRGMRPHVRLF